MKTRKHRFSKLCSCSPDVGDCNRCSRGILKHKYIDHFKGNRRKTQRKLPRSNR